MRSFIKEKFYDSLHTGMQQQLFLDYGGVLISSNDTLFDTGAYLNNSVNAVSTFVESIFQMLIDLEDHVVLEYEVESDIPMLNGLHTYVFQKALWEEKPVISWVIRDISHALETLKSYQQEHNENEISKHTSP